MKQAQIKRAEKTFIIFVLLLTPLVYSPALLDYFHHSRFVFSSVGLAIFCLGMLWQATKFKPFMVGLPEVLLGLFTGLNFASILWAAQKSEATFYAFKWLIPLSTFLLASAIFRKDRGEKIRFVGTVSAVTTFVILVLVTIKLLTLVTESGFSNDALYSLKVLFGHKSLISAYLTLLLPLNLIGYQSPGKIKKWVLALIGCQILMIVILQSRAMYLAVFVVMCLMLPYFYHHRQVFKNVRRQTVWVGAGALLVGLLSFFTLAGPDLLQRLNPTAYFESGTSGERRFVWYKTQGLLHDHPWLGVGAGNWKLEFPRFGVEGAYRLQDQDVIFTRAHNDFLELWSELGMAGFLLYVTLLAYPLVQLIRHPKQKFAWQRYLLAAGLLTFTISSLLDFPKERISFLVLLGLFLALARKHLQGPELELGTVVHRFLLFSLASGLAFASFIGVHRYYGEMKTRDLFAARAKQEWSQVVALAAEASNPWHRLDPSAVPISFYEGIAYYSMQKTEPALAAFHRAHAENPYNFHIVNNIATVLVSEGAYQEALQYLYLALSINPRFEEAIFNLAYCLNALGRSEEALIQIRLLPHESEKKEVFLREITKALQK